MTPHEHHYDPAAEDQAALWAAKLDGSVLTTTERQQLETWLTAAPGRRALLSSYCQLSTDLEQQMPLLEGIRDLPVEESSAQVTARPSPWSFRPLWVGAMLTAAAAVALVLWFNPSAEADTLHLATATAQRQSVVLADGTRVELNAHTRLTASLASDERRVRLTAGQAFFTVSKDPARPFFVETPGSTVRVTGTQFDVRADDIAKFQVTVLEGSVQVQPAGTTATAPFALKAGDQFLAGEVRALGDAEMNAVLAWRDGAIIFRDAPLSDVLAAFARHHDRSIQVSPTASQLRLGGRFNLDNLDQFFEQLQSLTEVIVKRDPHGNVQVLARREQ
ncbi:MAG: hypothetical protein C0518_00365 [Opitutus sp.]|nr:hypothetical protein [Opitutus sp.]